MATNYPSLAPGRLQRITGWAVQALLAAVFLAAAGAKLAGLPMMIETFDDIGLGQWFRYVTALVEITGATALLLPRVAAFGSVLLAATMLCAIVAHLTVLGTSALPAAILLALCLVISWLRRSQFEDLMPRPVGLPR